MEKNSENPDKMINESIFQGEIDRFKGVTINSSKEPKLDEEQLSEKLRNSIQKWKKEVR